MAEDWGTEAERDARHEWVIRRFPGGFTSWDQFVYCTLESVRVDTDLVEPPSLVGGTFAHHSRMVRLFIDGLVAHRDGYHAPLRYRITERGRAWLAEHRHEFESAQPDSAEGGADADQR